MKYCIDCKHFRKDKFREALTDEQRIIYGLCVRGGEKIDEENEFLSPKIKCEIKYHYASVERKAVLFGYDCGKDAKFFEEKK
jgi:hypothetical protein